MSSTSISSTEHLAFHLLTAKVPRPLRLSCCHVMCAPCSLCLLLCRDSLEDIDYSICTLEFETRRESYYWILEALDLYRPMVYEFARLNITRTVSLLFVAHGADPRRDMIGLGFWREISRGSFSMSSSVVDHN